MTSEGRDSEGDRPEGSADPVTLQRAKRHKLWIMVIMALGILLPLAGIVWLFLG